MTTEIPCAKVIVSNLFEPNDVLNLDRPPDRSDSISAISFVAERPSLGTTWSEVLDCAVDAALRFVGHSSWKNKSWLFFGSTDMWRTPNAITRRNRFWNTTPLPDSFPTASPEVEMQAGTKHRYAVLAKVNQQLIPSCAEWIRASQSGLLILTENRFAFSAIEVEEVFRSVFSGDDSSIDWNLAIQRLSKSDDVLVRCSGSFDDPDAAVDLIHNPSLNVP